MPHHCTPPSCVHYIAAPPTATRATSLCPTQLCTPHHHPSHSCTHYITAPSRSHMCCVTAPHTAVCTISPPSLVAARTALPRLLQPHMPCHCTPPSCMRYITTPSHGHTCCITTLPQPHMPRHCTPHSHVHH